MDDTEREERVRMHDADIVDSRTLETDSESHATTGGAAAAGAVTGGVIGLAGGPVGAAIGAVGGAIVGAAAERMMHADDTDSHPHTSESLSPESVSGPTAAEARASDMPSRTVEDTPTDRETP